MPFGLCNAPSTFQATMNQIFAPFLHRFIVVFFDDILIYSADLASHVEHLQQTLHCLSTHQLCLKLSKCVFGQTSVEYLGHMVSKGEVRADPKKISAMKDWPKPKSLRQLRGFLGLTGYYRRFIRGYASLAAPLTDLLRKDSFTWTSESTKAFVALKEAMTSAPVLKLPNFEEEFVVETDASNNGIGAILMQQGHPIFYFSQKLSARKQAASTYTKELLAITEAVLKWQQYLLGRFFIIRTDHKSIKELFQQVIQTPEQQIYVRKLMGFNFCIEYRTGKTNVAADALSRVFEDFEHNGDASQEFHMLTTASVPISEFLDTLRKENLSLPDLIELHRRWKNGELNSHYHIWNGLLMFKQRYYISPTSSLIPGLLLESHSSPIAGHGGVKRTLVRIAATFFWPNMKKSVEQFVATCITCQQTKYST